MAGTTTANTNLLIRAEVWSNQLKEVLIDNIMYGTSYVDWIGSEFSEGDTFTIPSVGVTDVSPYAEDQPVQYTSRDTGEWQFSVTEYIHSAEYITMKARQDLHYAAQLEAKFVPDQAAAISRYMEAFILKQGQPGTPGGQTVANQNLWNGHAHRWVGSDTAGTGARVLSVEDFARAKLALKMANVPLTNLVAMVDPTTAYIMETQPNLINFSNNPHWEGLVTTGITTGMRFIKNIFGFDVYESNYLPFSGTDQLGASETINSVASGTNAKANLFFSADSSVKPWKGAWRQMPKVDAEFNKDYQREEYVTTARFGAKIFRPENLVTVLSGQNIF